jgi:hypothetical protein
MRAAIRESKSLQPYEDWLIESGMVDRLERLRGRGLVCRCNTNYELCHADVLAREANQLKCE